MQIVRHVHGRGQEPETLDNVEALMLLVDNRKGLYGFFNGPTDLLHKIFLEGSLNWPMFIPWEEEKRRAIIDCIMPYCKDDTEKVVLISRGLATGEYLDPNDRGDVDFSIKDGGTASNPLEIRSIHDALLFLSCGGETMIASDGGGLSKTALMIFGAGMLLGEIAEQDLRDTIYGNMADLATSMSRTFRANRGVEGIILTPQAWQALEEEKARKGRQLPSNN